MPDSGQNFIPSQDLPENLGCIFDFGCRRDVNSSNQNSIIRIFITLNSESLELWVYFISIIKNNLIIVSMNFLFELNCQLITSRKIIELSAFLS